MPNINVDTENKREIVLGEDASGNLVMVDNGNPFIPSPPSASGRSELRLIVKKTDGEVCFAANTPFTMSGFKRLETNEAVNPPFTPVQGTISLNGTAVTSSDTDDLPGDDGNMWRIRADFSSSQKGMYSYTIEMNQHSHDPEMDVEC